MQTQPAAAHIPPADRTKPGRMLSLDVFRGATIAAMIMVNNQASSAAYPQLEHASWHGWTFTDLVFPFFLWIVGVAITLSFAKRVERGDNRHKLLMHVLQRSALIFLIGVALNGFPRYDFATIRIPGVLQRIAVCYLIASTIFLYAGTKARIIWTGALLTAYWLLMKLVPVPGCETGSMEIGCNFAKWVDGMLLPGHMYSHTKTWDPEGFISTLPAICNTLFGIFAGQILAGRKSPEIKTSWMFFAGNLMIFTALMLTTWMPINKQLWTTPYAIFTAGLAFVVFASCYWLVDVQGWRRFIKPFSIYGMNALVVYVLSGLFARMLSLIKFSTADGQTISLGGWIWSNLFEPFFSAPNASLAYSLMHVLVLFGVAWFMYRRNWIVRV